MSDDMIKNPYFMPEKPVSEESSHGQNSEEGIMDRSFVRTNQTGDKVYFIFGKEAHWVKNPETFTALGGNWEKVLIVKFSQLRKLKLTVDPIDVTDIHKYITEEKLPLQTYEPEIPQGATKEMVATAPGKEPEPGFTSIIIPAYFNSYPIFHYTGNCIGSVREHTDKEKTPYEIILVVNGMTDIKFDNLQQTKADKVIQNEFNKGYSYAVNQGIRMARGEYICILNNDAQVFSHWLSDMQEALQHIDLVMATPMYGRPFARSVESKELRDKTLDKSIQETFSDFKDFSCVLTRKKVFQQIGTFDESFFMYGEDLDFMRRMDKEEMRYFSTKRVNITHIIGGTSSSINETPDIMNESRKILKEKWGF